MWCEVSFDQPISGCNRSFHSASPTLSGHNRKETERIFRRSPSTLVPFHAFMCPSICHFHPASDGCILAWPPRGKRMGVSKTHWRDIISGESTQVQWIPEGHCLPGKSFLGEGGQAFSNFYYTHWTGCDLCKLLNSEQVQNKAIGLWWLTSPRGERSPYFSWCVHVFTKLCFHQKFIYLHASKIFCILPFSFLFERTELQFS